MNRHFLEFDKASEVLQEGDVLLFEGEGLTSFLIRRATEGVYSHVGVASAHGTNGSRIWECVEFKEHKGGRAINLRQYVESHKGFIDVFRVSDTKVVNHYNHMEHKVVETVRGLNYKNVTNTMRKMTGLPYGWRRIFWMAQNHIPLLRLFYNIDSVVNDASKDLIYPVCSTAVAYSFAKEGFDLVHHRSDMSTAPSDIARSPLLNYLFTLV